MKRRNFLVGAGATAVVSGGTYAWLRSQGYEVASPLPQDQFVAPPAKPALKQAYDPRALSVLRSLLAELLPGRSELGLPSALESGTLDYVVAASALPGLRAVRDEILKLTRYLDLQAKKDGATFAEMEPLQRSQLVRTTVDAPPKGRFQPGRALQALLRLSLEGYLGHPYYGGNKDARVWDALDIDMPRDRRGHHDHG